MSDWLDELETKRREAYENLQVRKEVLWAVPELISRARRADEAESRVEHLEREVERLQILNDNRDAMLKHWELNQRVLQGHMTTEQMHAELAEAHPRQYGNLA